MTDQERGVDRAGRRRKRFLTPQEKYVIWVQFLRGETAILEAADRARVDRSTIMKLRQVAKQSALHALAVSRPVVKPNFVDPELADGLLGWHDHHDRSMATEPRRERHPRVAGRLDDHHHLFGPGGQLRPQRFEFGGVSAEAVTRPGEHACLIRAGRLVGGTARDIDPKSDLQLGLLR